MSWEQVFAGDSAPAWRWVEGGDMFGNNATYGPIVYHDPATTAYQPVVTGDSTGFINSATGQITSYNPAARASLASLFPEWEQPPMASYWKNKTTGEIAKTPLGLSDDNLVTYFNAVATDALPLGKVMDSLGGGSEAEAIKRLTSSDWWKSPEASSLAGARVARGNADNGFLGDLGPIAQVLSFIPSPVQPFAQALNAINSADQGNFIAAALPYAVPAISEAISGAGNYAGTFDAPTSAADYGYGSVNDVAALSPENVGALTNAVDSVNPSGFTPAELEDFYNGDFGALTEDPLYNDLFPDTTFESQMKHYTTGEWAKTPLQNIDELQQRVANGELTMDEAISAQKSFNAGGLPQEQLLYDDWGRGTNRLGEMVDAQGNRAWQDLAAETLRNSGVDRLAAAKLVTGFDNSLSTIKDKLLGKDSGTATAATGTGGNVYNTVNKTEAEDDFLKTIMGTHNRGAQAAAGGIADAERARAEAMALTR